MGIFAINAFEDFFDPVKIVLVTSHILRPATRQLPHKKL